MPLATLKDQQEPKLHHRCVEFYIRNMPNIDRNLDTGQHRFIEDVARLLLPWRVPAAARLYGYLLLRPRPVSLDQITRNLGVSKSTASVAARLLESYTLAHRHREAGTKRALYAVADDYEAMFRQQSQLLDALAGQLNAGSAIADSARVRARLKEMAEVHQLVSTAMVAALRRWRHSRRGLEG
jgi:predicted transcriptional regulator